MRLLKLLGIGVGGVVVVGVVGVGVLLAQGSAEIEVTNVDCDPIAVPTDLVGGLARQLPVLELPTEPIAPGTTARARVPAGTYEVELRPEAVRISWLAVSVEQPLPEPARSVVVDGRELVGAGVVRIELANGSRHVLRLVCGG
jgi:hypothetical protein